MARVVMTIAEHGGRVKVVGKRDNKIAAMEIDEHGGRMDVYAKGDFLRGPHATMGVNKDGNGEVNTWDSNGYPLADLK